MQVLESTIEKEVVKYAQTKGYITIKLTSRHSRGWPDRLFITTTARFFFIEFKAPGEAPSKLQLFRIELLRKHGCAVFVVDNTREGKEIIDAMGSAPIPRTGDKATFVTGGVRPPFESGIGEDLDRASFLPPTEGAGVREEDASDSATEADGAYVAQ